MKWLDPTWWNGLADLIVVGVGNASLLPDSYLLLNKNQDKVNIKAFHQGLDLDEVKAALSKHSKLPVVVLLAEGQAMARAISPEEVQDAVSAVLGVKVEDEDAFFVELLPHAGGQVLASVIRKAAVEAAESQLELKEGRIVAFGSSPYHLAKLVSALPEYQSGSLAISRPDGGDLQFKDGLADSNSSKQASLGLSEFASKAGLPEAALFLYALGYHVWTECSSPQPNMPNTEQFKAALQVARLSRIATAAALALGIWFFSISLLRIQAEREKQSLEEQYSQNLPVVNALAQLDEKIAAKAQLQEELSQSTLRSSRSSFLLDRVAALLPLSIRLDRMVLGPEEEDFKRAGMEAGHAFDLLIMGSCAESAPITTFSEQLSKAEWVKRVSVERSEMDFVEGQYQFVFALESIYMQAIGEDDV